MKKKWKLIFPIGSKYWGEMCWIEQVIVLVGYPGSGKSHFSSQHAAQSKYDVINRDLVGSWQKCVALMERSLDKGQSVLIDNTNPDRESRSRFLKICAARRIPCRCFYMKSSLSHAQHNNKVSQCPNRDSMISTASH